MTKPLKQIMALVKNCNSNTFQKGRTFQQHLQRWYSINFSLIADLLYELACDANQTVNSETETI